jgi:hypothetical protein
LRGVRRVIERVGEAGEGAGTEEGDETADEGYFEGGRGGEEDVPAEGDDGFGLDLRGVGEGERGERGREGVGRWVGETWGKRGNVSKVK